MKQPHHPMTEFELISHYFQTDAPNRADVVLGIGDDAALLKPPVDQLLVVTIDTLIENVHFLPNTAAHTIGHKALAVSLSDLAAMGAEPAWVVLSISLPTIDETWLAQFCEGFFKLLKEHQLQLVGGNTTRGPLSISTHLTGFVPPEKALRRDGAKPNDLIYVTGSLGDAALALRCLKQELTVPTETLSLLQTRLETPTPRVATGLALRGIATAAIDISDGLTADLGHILQQSQVGATLNLQNLPLSRPLQNLSPDIALPLALNGGDDYELCFTINPAQAIELEQIFSKTKVVYSHIGTVEAQSGLRLMNGTHEFKLDHRGYEHFSR